MRILFAEDERAVRNIVRRMFEFLTFKVTAVSSGEEALKIFSSDFFDVVVTDYSMGGMNGIELAKKIRSISPTTPIVLMSADPPMNELEHVDWMIVKPAKMEDLIQLSKFRPVHPR